MSGLYKLIYVGTLPPHPGGSAISGWQIVDGLARLGHNVRALAPVTLESTSAAQSFASRNLHVRLTRYLVPFYETAPGIQPSDKYRQLDSQEISSLLPLLIENDRPDVIVIGRETFAWNVPEIANSYGIPCLLRVAGATTLGILAGTLPPSYSTKLLTKYRLADLVVTPALHMKDSLERLGIPNVKVIPNAVDLERFRFRPKSAVLLETLGIPGNSVVVSHVSGLDYIKRPLDFIASCLEAVKENDKIVPFVVGDGPCRTSMEELCKANGLSERFLFSGWVEYSVIQKYYSISDMVVMPCENETQARVYLETQACGRVLVASDIAAAREVVRDGETGVLFRVGDIDGLTSAILSLARDEQRRTRIGTAARLQVESRPQDAAIRAYSQEINHLAEKGRL